MAKPAKKKSTPKKAAKKPIAKKPIAKKPVAAKTKPAKKATAKAPAPTPRVRPAPPSDERSGTTPYAPKPIEGIGWPAFRYPL